MEPRKVIGSLNKVFRHVLSLLFAASSLLLVQCDEQGTINPVGPDARLIILTELAAVPNRVSAGGGLADIMGRVSDQDDRPYAGTIVTFDAAQGSVTAVDTTDDEGRFEAVYQAGATPGTDTLTITVLDVQAVLYISVVGVSADLTLNVGRTSVLANGIDTTFVTATLIGNEGPIQRVAVRFETSAGNFNGQSITFANTGSAGTATVMLTAPSSNEPIVASITASTEDQIASISIEDGSAERSLRKSGEQRIAGSDAEANTTITFRGVSIEVEADLTLLPGDGQSTTTIRALVKEANFQAIANAPVSFSAELGSIPFLALTNAAGVAEVTLTSARVAGVSDRIIAGYGPALADTAVITYAEAVSAIDLSAGSGSILADGEIGVDITARVIGGTGLPSANVRVTFFSDGGFISQTEAVTDAEGVARSRLTGPSSENDQVITVRAEVERESLLESESDDSPPWRIEKAAGVIDATTVGSIRTLSHTAAFTREMSDATGKSSTRRERSLRQVSGSQTPEAIAADDVLTDSLLIVARGVTLRLSVNPDSIIARSGVSSNVLARVFETTSGNPIINDTVRFSTTEGSIPSRGVLDQDGRTVVAFLSDEQVGEALIVARFGTAHRDSAVIAKLPTISSIQVSSDKQAMLLGGIDSANVSVRVLDALGGFAQEIAVIYENDFDPGSRQITTDLNGIARFQVVSPSLEVDTVLTLTVSSGGVEEEYQIDLKAISRVITATPDSVSAGSETSVDIVVQAFETSTRRPVAEDTVWFSALQGVVQAFAILDRNGICRTTYQVGDEPGIAWVFGQLGSLTLDSVGIELVEAIDKVELTAARMSVLANGIDTTKISARVSNILDQPTPNVWVRFETDNGTIQPADALTDENGRVESMFITTASSVDETAVITVSTTFIENDAVPGEGLPDIETSVPESLTDQEGNVSRSLMNQPSLRGLSDIPARDLKPVLSLRKTEALLRPFDADEAVDSLSVMMRGVTMDLNVEPSELRADGESQASVNLQLSETTSGAPISDGVVQFGATRGVIPAQGVTSVNGTIVDSLIAGLTPGISIIRAIYGNTILAVDSVLFTPDPARMILAMTLNPDEAPADGETEVAILSRVTDLDGDPIEGVAVRYTLEGGRSALIDPDEYREVTRWQNTFRIEDRSEVTGLRLRMQIRGVSSANTKIYLNRTAEDDVELPIDPFWSEATIDLTDENINAGINRIEIIGGRDEDLTDRFSVAGIRLELIGSHVLDEVESDDNGLTQISITADEIEGIYVFRTAIVDDTTRFTEQTLVLDPLDPATVLVASVADTLLGSGSDETDIIVLVTDIHGNPVGDGHQIELSADPEGEIDPEVIETIGDGTAGARFTSPVAEENIDVDLIASLGELQGEWSLTVLGVTLELTTEDDRMLADGESTMRVQARLETVDDVPIEGRRIHFVTTAGTITPSEPTDPDGVALVTLTAADTTGVATITATFGEGITNQAEVLFVPVVGSIELSADPESIRGNGRDETTLTVTVVDGLGNDAIAVRVDLEVDQGELSRERLMTDQDGRATADLSGFTTVDDDTITVIATVSEYELADTLEVVVRGITIELSANPDSIVARENSYSDVSAQVFETTSGNPVTGDSVRFTTSLGIISGFAGLNNEGIARVTLSAQERTGRAEITVRYTNLHQDTVFVELLPQIGILDVMTDRGSLLAGGIDEAIVSVMVTDPLGDAAPNALVEYEVDWYLNEGHSVRTDDDGIASFNVLSPAAEVDSAMRVTVTAGDLEEEVRIVLRGITRSMTAEPDSISAGSEEEVEITFRAIETASRRPVVEDTIWFSATDGSVQAFNVLDDNGTAQVSLEVGDNPGNSWVIGQIGTLEFDSVMVVLVEPVADATLTSAQESLLGNGRDATTITATITNILGEASPGVVVRFVADQGTISPSFGETDGDGVVTVELTGVSVIDDDVIEVVLSTDGYDLTDTLRIPVRGVTIDLSVNPDSIVARDNSTSTVTAHVYETNSGNPIGGDTVRFAADLGFITARAVLTDEGLAQVVYSAGGTPGQAAIIGRYSISHRDTTHVELLSQIGALNASTNQQSILAGGIQATQIDVSVTDPLGRPAPDVVVSHEVDWFPNDGGSIRTDEDGSATFIITSPPAEVDSAMRITVTAGELEEVVRVALRGITRTVSADPDSLSAGSDEPVDITFRAIETTSRRPVISDTIWFSATDGSIEAYGVLANNGSTTVSLEVGDESGTTWVIGQLGSLEPDSARVELVDPVATSTLTSAQESLLGDGRDQTVITGTVTNILGEPSPGVTMRFAVDQGSISPQTGETDENGVVTTTLTGISSVEDEVIQVIASADDYDLTDTLLVPIRGVTIDLTAIPDSIIARENSTSTVTAHVYETNSGNPVTGDTVSFGASSGFIAAEAALSNDGLARVTYSAGDTPGTATVTARFALTHRDTTFIELLSRIGSMSASASPVSMLAGGIDAVEVEVIITDPLGEVAPDVLVEYEVDWYPDDPGSVRTDEDGTATFSVISPAAEADSALRITLSAGGLEEEVRVGLRSILRTITAAPDSIAAGSDNEVEITFRALETASRRPVVADTVWFSASDGTIQSYGVLNDNGLTTVNLVVGEDPGVTLVFGQLGSLDEDTVSVVLIEPVTATTLSLTSESILANGLDTTVVTAFVENELGQPVANVLVLFSADDGEVDPEMAETDEDGNASVVYTSSASTSDQDVYIRTTAIPVIRMQQFDAEDPDDEDDVPVRMLRSTSGPLRTQASLFASTAYFDNRGDLFRPDWPFDRLFEVDDILDSISIELRGVSLSLRTSPNEVRADGSSKVGVHVRLYESTSGVAISGAPLRLGATLGSIPANGTTGDDGTLVDSLTAGVVAGRSIITAIYGNTITSTDTVTFTYDPQRLEVVLTLDGNEIPADSSSTVTLTAIVVDEDDDPVEAVPVTFFARGTQTVLIDLSENREVTRWENTFRVEDPETIESVSLKVQLRGIDSPGTHIELNREEVDLELPSDELWSETTLELPTELLIEGSNRIDIIGGDIDGVTDRFSVAGVRLALIADHQIDESDSDVNGEVSTVYIADRTAGSVTMVAALTEELDVNDARRVTLISGDPAQVLVSTVADTLLSNGLEETDILVLITDSLGNPVGDSYTVDFSVDSSGTVDPSSATTLGDGTASATYTAPASSIDENCSIIADSDGIPGDWTILLRGPNIRVTTADDRLLADGNSTTAIRARLSTPDGAPIVGRTVRFNTSAGVVTSVTQTDGFGYAEATLTSSGSPDTALVVSTFGPFVRDSVEVEFTTLIGQVSLSTDPESILGNGEDEATITVSVIDGVEEPSEDIRVSLSVNQGSLSRSQVTTDANGLADVSLTGFVTVSDDSIRVIATVSGSSETDTLYVPIKGITVTLTSESDSLSANGVSNTTLTAQVVETGTGNPITGETVRFSTSLGSITGSATLSEDGTASATMTVGQTEGTATVVARYVFGLADTVQIELVDPVGALNLALDSDWILANGIDEAAVTASITDRWGEPAPGELVTLSFSGPASLSPTLGNTDESGELAAIAVADASITDSIMVITAQADGGALIESDTLYLRGVTLLVSASPDLITGDGESTSTITARVQETTSGRSVTSGNVEFTSSAGSITAAAELDNTGEAQVSLRSASNPALASVVAYYGDQLTDTTSVAFANRYSYLTVSGGRSAILAEGVDTTKITAEVMDTLGRPAEEVWVSFNVLSGNGSVSGDSVMTDEDGLVEVIYTSIASVNNINAQVEVSAGVLTDTVDVILLGITVSVSADPDSMPANGMAVSDIIGRVRQTSSGTPVTARNVTFSANLGEITGSATLDEMGRAAVDLIAARASGNDTITVYFGQTLTGAVPIVYVETVDSVTVTSDEETLLGDGLDMVTITARVLDEIGDPAGGVEVSFVALNGGSLSQSNVQTDNDGYATVQFTGFASAADSIITIEATAEGGAADNIDVTLLGITTEFTASPSRLRANGRTVSTITLRAFETTANTPVDSQRVDFSADRGQIEGYTDLDSTGRATVLFTSPADSGTASIYARFGDLLRDSLTIRCELSEPEHATLAISPNVLSIEGGGGEESAQLTVTVTDEDGERVPDGTEVTIVVTPDLGVRFSGDVDTVTVETTNGLANVTVNSGDQSGSVNFRVFYGGNLIATGGTLVIEAGPPYRIVLRTDVGLLYQPAEGIMMFPISALVTDEFTNPVPDSTVIRFTIDPDTIASIDAVGYTDRGLVATLQDSINTDVGVWITFSVEYAGELLTVIAASVNGDVTDTSSVILPGAVVGGDPDTLVSTIDRANLYADGRDYTFVRVNVLDADGDPVADLTEVNFSANLGTITPTRYTVDGAIVNRYTTGRVTGSDTIRIVADGVRDSIVVTLRPGDPSSIGLTVEDTVLRAGGIEATAIYAEVRDQFGNLVMGGTSVLFTSELGEIDASALTNANGVAEASLVSGDQIGESIITAVSDSAMAQASVRIISGPADGLVIENINRNTIGVRGSGTPETATLVFEVRDEWGIPVDTSNQVYVRFTLGGPDRIINVGDSSAFLEPDSVLTDANGLVAVNLNSGYYAGTVEVTAAIGDSISGQAISVAIHGGPPDIRHFSVIPGWCNLTGRLGTEVDSVEITAAVGDRYSNPTVPGTVVYFYSTGGVIQGSAQTDELGFCSVWLRTVNPQPPTGIDTIIAQTVDYNDQEITDTTVVLVSGPTNVWASPNGGWQIPYGSYQDITITVADEDSIPLSRGTSVSIDFEAFDQEGADVEGIRLTGDATNGAYDLGDCDGRTQFNVSLFNYVAGLDGATVNLIVTVTSRNNNEEVTFGGTALGQVISTSASRVQLVPEEIVADDEDVCNVNISVLDTNSVAIPDVPPYAIDVSVTAGTPTVTPPENASDEDGAMQATITGAEVAIGTVYVTVQGDTLDDQPTLSFVPGPPENLSIRVLDPQLEVGGDTTTVVVTVTDANGNATVDGTSVLFEADDGSFSPTSTVTNGGTATSVFSSGITAGDASFDVTASHRGGDVTETYENLEFTAGPPGVISVTAEDYFIRVGNTAEVSVVVFDTYGNTVPQNTPLDVSVTPNGAGAVAPLSIQTDAEGAATVSFTAGTTSGDTAHVAVDDTSGTVNGTSPVFVFIAGIPGSITLSVTADTVGVGLSDTITAVVEDAYGNVVSDTTLVTFTRSPEIGVLSPSSATTNSGSVSTRLSNVTTAGDVVITAGAGDVEASYAINFTADTLFALAVSADPSTVDTLGFSTITVTAEDRYGNAVSGALIDFTITNNPGGCTINPAQRTTNADGVASAVFRAGNTTGWVEITVSSNATPAIDAVVDVIIQ